MTRDLPTTYRRMGALLHETGMVSEEKMRGVLDDAATYADAELDQYAAAHALESFGVAVSVHADDIDSIHEGYRGLLADAVEAAGGEVAITDVRIVEGEGGFEGGRLDAVEFERDGRVVSIPAEHFAADYYDHDAACRAIAETAHGDDPRSWRNAGFAREPGVGYDSIMVLATPEQREALHQHLGLTFP
ncbi:hypothetical protein [Streptomyces sp. HB132]|uniref:hypothetical protein n=1 Tax=Streptomyces sp. HB132 TaxID=767388 RepID=UPI001962158C|nr:hypothetical protein [Streptomyces sp. HB132]MBM7439065.1 hypothetical protein [Streptomyces sp. HB132]